MKIVVIGSSGLIGTKVVAQLRQPGHQVIAAAPDTGINTITGEGLAAAMNDTDVVIDLANSPSFDDKAVMEFFQTAGRNLLAAEINAGVKHRASGYPYAGVSSLRKTGQQHSKSTGSRSNLTQSFWQQLFHPAQPGQLNAGKLLIVIK